MHIWPEKNRIGNNIAADFVFPREICKLTGGKKVFNKGFQFPELCIIHFCFAFFTLNDCVNQMQPSTEAGQKVNPLLLHSLTFA